MKRKVSHFISRKFRAVVLLAVSQLVVTSAAVAQADMQEAVQVRSIRFVTPLVEKWIAEYAKVRPDVQVQLAGKDMQADDVDIQLLAAVPAEAQFALTVGRYAILPIAGADNTALASIGNRKLNARQLKTLYFERDIFDEDDDETPSKPPLEVTVYSGANAGSFAHPFAAHFGRQSADLKGKKIAGDDLFLINAVQKDASGVSFNSLNYVFDVTSRQLRDGIVILPLDLKKGFEEIVRQPDLDKTIALLEAKAPELIPVEAFSAVVNTTTNSSALQFLHWVLTEGQKFNHELGFLQLDEKTSEQQQQQLATKSKKNFLLVNK
ncbi:MAG: hypothetical protein LBR06_01255 [Bacteroidales bacterium]|jgi:ABC-type phosphate transport system substrate-binding protein|nr:hypothetical protein [Bacteroidales bacterium]